MQALSIWPSKNDFRVIPRLDMEVAQVGSSCIGRTMRRRGKTWDFGDCSCHCRRSDLISVSSSSWGCKSRGFLGSSQFDMKCRAFNRYSKKGPFRAAVALAWKLEGHSISNEFVDEESVSLDGTSGKNGNLSNMDKIENEELDESDKEKGTEKNKLGKEKKAGFDARALAQSVRFARTAEDVEELLKDKGELPFQVFSTMIKRLGKDKRLEAAMAVVQWLKKKKKDPYAAVGPDIFIYNSLLGAVKESEQFEEVENVMNDMTTVGLIPDVVTYNILMGIFIEQGNGVVALKLFEEMERNGLSPSPSSYSTALLAYRRMEDGFGALKFYLQLKEKYQNGCVGKDVPEDWENEFPNHEDFTVRTCYKVMRQWLAKRENLSTNVLKLLTEMDRARLRTGRSEFERLIWACTREEHYMVAKELYSRIRESDSEISLSVCNHVIWVMGKAKKWWAALEIYEDLLDKGPKPNNMSYELIAPHFNILLSAAGKRRIWRWGVRLLTKMKDKGLKPGSKEWNAVLVACSKASETSAAVQIFKRMVEQGEKPTIISYGALLSALEKGKLYDVAHRVWENMIKVGVEANSYAYTIMASIYTAEGKFNVVDSIIREMVSSGIEPTVVTYNAIISGCARNNMCPAAYEWFQKMKAQKISPNEISYEMLIEALTKDGKPKLAYEMYLRAQNEGLNLSSKAYDAVIQSSETYGATINVDILGPRPPEKKKTVHIRKNLSEFCNLADVPRRSKPFVRKEIYPPRTEEKL